jgi:hypothetical protein
MNQGQTLSNVIITSAEDGEVLQYDGTSSVWRNQVYPDYQSFAAYYYNPSQFTLAANSKTNMENYTTFLISNPNFDNSNGQYTVPASGLYIVSINSNISSPNGTSTQSLSAFLTIGGTDHPVMPARSYVTVPAIGTYNVGLSWMGYLTEGNIIYGVLINATANDCDVEAFEFNILGPF